MQNLWKRAAATLVCAATLCTAFMLPAAVEATPAYRDDDWELVGRTPAINGCGSTQGMAVGEKYAYSAQVNSSNTTTTIMRVDLETGEYTVMKDGKNGRNYFLNTLGHANDMDVAVIDGKEYLYILGTSTLFIYEIDGEKLHLKSEYNIIFNGSAFDPGSFAIESITDEKTTFLFKSGIYISRASVETGAAEGKLKVNSVCTLDYTGFEVDGCPCDYSTFLNQAMFYKDGFIFIVKAGCEKVETINQSIIIGYDMTDAKGVIKPRADLVFFLESSKDYPALLEAEDCAIGPDGKMYFNTNGRKTDYDTDHDGIFRLKDYTFSAEQANPGNFSVRYKSNRGIGTLNTRTVLIGDFVYNTCTNINRKGYAHVGWTADRASDDTVFCVNKNDAADKKWLTEAEMGTTYTPYLFAPDERVENLTTTAKDTVTFTALWSMYGDATGDEKLTIADALAIRLYAAGYYSIDASVMPYMDVNGDGVVNTADAQIIIAYLADAITKLPA